jgi:hypothetical protein
MSTVHRAVLASSAAVLLGTIVTIFPAAPAVAATWSVVPTPNATELTNQLNAVDARAADQVWVVGLARFSEGVGTRPLAIRSSGGTWTITPTPALTDYGSFSGVDATAANDAWAVGQQEVGGSARPLTERWNGSSWSIVPSPLPSGAAQGELTEVKAFSGTNAWAVGSYFAGSRRTLVQRWDGTAWNVLPSPSPHPSTNLLQGVDGVASDDLWAVGSAGTDGLVMRWNGATWSQVALPPLGPDLSRLRLEDVAAVSATDVWIVGSAQRGCCQPVPYFLHWTGQGWQHGQPAGVPATLSAVTALSPNQVYAVGSTTISRWDGGAWRVEPVTVPGPLRGISAAGAATVWAAGDVGEFPSSTTLVLRTTNG